MTRICTVQDGWCPAAMAGERSRVWWLGADDASASASAAGRVLMAPAVLPGALLKELGLGALADVLGDLKVAVRPAALGVHDPLGHAVTVEVRHLLDQVVVLQQQRAVAADGLRELVARRRDAGVGGGSWPL